MHDFVAGTNDGETGNRAVRVGIELGQKDPELTKKDCKEGRE